MAAGLSDLVIRPLTFEDLEKAFRLSTIIGWNQQLDDWRLLLRLAPAGAFAALDDAYIVGTAIGIDYGGFAWIAMMLVDPAYRNRGLGARLLEAAMNAVPAHLPVRLDATPMGRPLYQKYGFEDEATISRLVNDGSNRGEALLDSRVVRPLTASDLETIVDRDREVFGGTRDAVLEWAFHGAAQYAHVVRSPDGLPHYCFGRRGRLFDQIGPVVAGDEDIAQGLIRAAVAAAVDRPIVVDAFDSHTGFTAALRSRGFSVQRRLFRMGRPGGPGTRATGAGEGPLVEFAICGPEFA